MDKFDYAEYEETLKNQPLYVNKFNVTPAEKDYYMQTVPQWFKAWQQELDRIYDG
jgi:hypothetical protein